MADDDRSPPAPRFADVGAHGPLLVGDRVRLRATRDGDAERRQSFGASVEINRGFGGSATEDRPMSIEEARDGLRSGPDTEARFAWIIADDDDRLVGGCRLHDVDLQHRSARFAIGLADPARLGQGLGSEATRLVVAHAFDDLDLHRVDLLVLADNVRAVRAYEKAGFRTEGRLRQTLWRDGQWHDDLLLAILAPEYAERRGRQPDPAATDRVTGGD